MFSDKYGLTKAVLSGRKTMTKRIVPKGFFSCMHDILDNNTLVFEDSNGDWHDIRESSYAFKVGEVVAVAQSYKSVTEYLAKKSYNVAKWMDEHHITKNAAGWLNKMFVKAELMIFKIRITNVRVEHLQDISEQDILAEGIQCLSSVNKYYFESGDHERKFMFNDPREAYAALIDKVSGKGTWESNPYTFAYEFELIK